ncbi:MAG: DNA helicase RecQ [Bernardetiaceae bacterium]|nr:DNA helicase RecQ [Bernardetiaceae bacterium]
MVEQKINLKKSLKEVFGYNQFRGNQEAIINNLLSGKNTFVIMPTGAGKSLCYQLPAIVQPGTAVVISPLIALMKNQVDQLNAVGVQAEFLNSTLSKSEIKRVKKETLEGKVKLLYVAPESLTKESNIAFLREANVSFFAIDEAHCISEWGHDFRPEYRRIRQIIEEVGNLPIIALTATATPKVQLDIEKNLHMDDVSIFKSSFNRENLYYEVQPKDKDVDKQLIKFIKKHKGKSGIIYCLSRKKVEEIAELLRINDVKALPYHAGLEASARVRNQDAFLNEEADVIVATIAFGMGIDKPDVRFVIHYDVPKSLEGYYQETGRAGRDGLEGHCLMFYNTADIQKLEKFNKDKSVTERENARYLLQEISLYAESKLCRRLQLLYYFGEAYDEAKCNHGGNHCDNCKIRHSMRIEGKEFIRIVLEAVSSTAEHFEKNHLIDLILGKTNDYIESYEQDKLSVFGAGAEYDYAFWQSVLRQAMFKGFLTKDIDRLNVVKLTEKGKNFLARPQSVEISQEQAQGEEEEGDVDDVTDNTPSYDQGLYEQLRKLCKRIAKQENLPHFVIFQDPSLLEMATVYPVTEEELTQINGVGLGKVKRFGKPFINLIKKYVEDNDIETATDVLVKSTANKSKVKIFIIQQIDRKVDLEEIAEAQNLSLDELIEEIEHICYSGTKLHLDYYINRIMDEERQEEIYDYFMEADTDNIAAAMEELGDEDFSEEEIRLMRIKFMSEYAM